jgi:hypothetical protein
MLVDREELVALRDVIDAMLRLPDAVRSAIARWFAPQLVKPNGHDVASNALAATPKASEPEPTPRHEVSASARSRGKAVDPAKAAERPLVVAMGLNPGASVNTLAKATGATRSTTGERLRRLATQGLSRKTLMGDGGWRAKRRTALKSQLLARQSLRKHPIS